MKKKSASKEGNTKGYQSDNIYDEKLPADAVYEYRTGDDWPAFEVRRQGRGAKKSFDIRHPNMLSFGDRGPEDQWDWRPGRGDHPALLYKLPELLAADPASPVWIAEGERDADLLIGLGQVATTNPHGATAWLPEHGEALAGRHVIVCQDADQPGAKRTETIRRTLGKAASISLVRFTEFKKGFDVGDFVDAGNSLDDLMARVEHTLPIVIGNLSETVDRIEDALIAAGVEIYGRSDNLVRPITTERGESLLIAVSPHDLRDIISKHCELLRNNAKGDLVPAAATLDHANTLLARVGRWRFQEINGIHTAPIVQGDGSVLDKPGYDPSTGLYFILPGKVTIGTTRAEAEISIEALCDLMAETATVTKTDLSVLLSAILTPLVRPVIDVAPLHIFRAHQAGTGKSFTVDVISTLAQGQKASGITYVQGNDDENRKLLSTMALQGSPLISLDNVNGELSGDFLCQLVERHSVQPRILGRSEAPRIKNIFAIYGGGNNIQIRGDLCRRALLCNLDRREERPETHKYNTNPLKIIEENREIWLGHCLTIVRAWLLSDETVATKPYGSFEAYSRFVRAPLMWLGFPDPCDSIEAIREDDPERSAIQALFSAWPQEKTEYTANELIAASLQKLPPTKEFPTGRSTQDTPLGRALQQVASDNRDQVAKLKLAKYLSSIQKRIVEKRYIVINKDRTGTNNYTLQTVEEMF